MVLSWIPLLEASKDSFSRLSAETLAMSRYNERAKRLRNVRMGFQASLQPLFQSFMRKCCGYKTCLGERRNKIIQAFSTHHKYLES